MKYMDQANDPRAYIQVVTAIRDDLASGRYGRGERIPTITELQRETGHARQTYARAMKILESEGLITRIPGVGYVAGSAQEVTGTVIVSHWRIGLVAGGKPVVAQCSCGITDDDGKPLAGDAAHDGCRNILEQWA